MNNKYGLRSYVINLGSCEDHVYHSYVSSTVHSPKWPLNVFFTVEYRGGHGGGGGTQTRNTAQNIDKNRNTASKIDGIPKLHTEKSSYFLPYAASGHIVHNYLNF